MAKKPAKPSLDPKPLSCPYSEAQKEEVKESYQAILENKIVGRFDEADQRMIRIVAEKYYNYRFRLLPDFRVPLGEKTPPEVLKAYYNTYAYGIKGKNIGAQWIQVSEQAIEEAIEKILPGWGLRHRLSSPRSL